MARWVGAVWALDYALMSVMFTLVKTSTLFALPGWHSGHLQPKPKGLLYIIAPTIYKYLQAYVPTHFSHPLSLPSIIPTPAIYKNLQAYVPTKVSGVAAIVSRTFQGSPCQY